MTTGGRPARRMPAPPAASGVPPRAVDAELAGVVAGRVAQREVARGTVLQEPGDRSQESLVVIQGWVDERILCHGDASRLIAVRGPGDPIAPAAFIVSARWPTRAVARTDATVAVLAREDFEALLAESPSFARATAAFVAQEIRRANASLRALLADELSSRLATMLVWMAQRHGVSGEDGIAVEPRLSQQEWAELAGATRVAVNMHFQGWVRAGLLQIAGHRRLILPVDDEGLPLLARKISSDARTAVA